MAPRARKDPQEQKPERKRRTTQPSSQPVFTVPQTTKLTEIDEFRYNMLLREPFLSLMGIAARDDFTDLATWRTSLAQFLNIERVPTDLTEIINDDTDDDTALSNLLTEFYPQISPHIPRDTYDQLASLLVRVYYAPYDPSDSPFLSETTTTFLYGVRLTLDNLYQTVDQELDALNEEERRDETREEVQLSKKLHSIQPDIVKSFQNEFGQFINQKFQQFFYSYDKANRLTVLQDLSAYNIFSDVSNLFDDALELGSKIGYNLLYPSAPFKETQEWFEQNFNFMIKMETFLKIFHKLVAKKDGLAGALRNEFKRLLGEFPVMTWQSFSRKQTGLSEQDIIATIKQSKIRKMQKEQMEKMALEQFYRETGQRETVNPKRVREIKESLERPIIDESSINVSEKEIQRYRKRNELTDFLWDQVPPPLANQIPLDPQELESIVKSLKELYRIQPFLDKEYSDVITVTQSFRDIPFHLLFRTKAVYGPPDERAKNLSNAWLKNYQEAGTEEEKTINKELASRLLEQRILDFQFKELWSEFSPSSSNVNEIVDDNQALQENIEGEDHYDYGVLIKDKQTERLISRSLLMDFVNHPMAWKKKDVLEDRIKNENTFSPKKSDVHVTLKHFFDIRHEVQELGTMLNQVSIVPIIFKKTLGDNIFNYEEVHDPVKTELLASAISLIQELVSTEEQINNLEQKATNYILKRDLDLITSYIQANVPDPAALNNYEPALRPLQEAVEALRPQEVDINLGSLIRNSSLRVGPLIARLLEPTSNIRVQGQNLSPDNQGVRLYDPDANDLSMMCHRKIIEDLKNAQKAQRAQHPGNFIEVHSDSNNANLTNFDSLLRGTRDLMQEGANLSLNTEALESVRTAEQVLADMIRKNSTKLDAQGVAAVQTSLTHNQQQPDASLFQQQPNGFNTVQVNQFNNFQVDGVHPDIVNQLLTQLNGTQAQLQAQLNDAYNQLTNAKVSNQFLSEHLTNAQASNQVLSEQLNNAQAANQVFEERINSLSYNVLQERALNSSLNNQLTSIEEARKNDHKKFQNRLSGLQSENNVLKQNYAMLQENSQNAQTKANQQIGSLRAELNFAIEQNASLIKARDHLSNELSNLKAEHEQLKTEKANLQKEATDYKTEATNATNKRIQDLESILQEKANQLDLLDQSNANLTQIIHEKNHEIEVKNREIEVLQAQLPKIGNETDQPNIVNETDQPKSSSGLASPRDLPSLENSPNSKAFNEASRYFADMMHIRLQFLSPSFNHPEYFKDLSDNDKKVYMKEVAEISKGAAKIYSSIYAMIRREERKNELAIKREELKAAEKAEDHKREMEIMKLKFDLSEAAKDKDIERKRIPTKRREIVDNLRQKSLNTSIDSDTRAVMNEAMDFLDSNPGGDDDYRNKMEQLLYKLVGISAKRQESATAQRINQLENSFRDLVSLVGNRTSTAGPGYTMVRRAPYARPKVIGAQRGPSFTQRFAYARQGPKGPRGKSSSTKRKTKR